MPGSRPRPIGRPTEPQPGANLPGGWAGYQLARDLGAPRPRPLRHGNYRHGDRCAETLKTRRLVRACARMLRAGLWNAPVPGIPPRSLGWLNYWKLHDARAQAQPMRVE